MSFSFQGFDSLEQDLIHMADRLEHGQEVNQALQAGAAPIEQQMKQNASVDPQIRTGSLHDAIKTGRVKTRRSGAKRITIGIHRAELNRQARAQAAGESLGGKKLAYYANPVEYGHGGPAPAPAHPFARPAFDTRHEEAYEIMKHHLRDTLRRK